MVRRPHYDIKLRDTNIKREREEGREGGTASVMHWVWNWTECWVNVCPQSMHDSCACVQINTSTNLIYSNSLLNNKKEGMNKKKKKRKQDGKYIHERRSRIGSGWEASASSSFRHTPRTGTTPSSFFNISLPPPFYFCFKISPPLSLPRQSRLWTLEELLSPVWRPVANAAASFDVRPTTDQARQRALGFAPFYVIYLCFYLQLYYYYIYILLLITCIRVELCWVRWFHRRLTATDEHWDALI